MVDSSPYTHSSLLQLTSHVGRFFVRESFVTVIFISVYWIVCFKTRKISSNYVSMARSTLTIPETLTKSTLDIIDCYKNLSYKIVGTSVP